MRDGRYTAEDFFSILGPDHRVHPQRAADRANQLLDERRETESDFLKRFVKQYDELAGSGDGFEVGDLPFVPFRDQYGVVNLPKSEQLQRDIASAAQAKHLSLLAKAKERWLAELLQDAPVVYSRWNEYDKDWCPWDDRRSTDKISGDTHQARLIDIKSIAKDEHE